MNCGVDRFTGLCEHPLCEFVGHVAFGLHSHFLPRVNTHVSASAQRSGAAIYICRKAQAAMKIPEDIITFKKSAHISFPCAPRM